MGKIGEINKERYGKIECCVNEVGKMENVLKRVLNSRRSIFSIVSRLRAGRSGVQIPAGARDISLIQNVQANCGAHPLSCSLSTEVLCPG